MEITYHLPSSEWYVNSSVNNLSYWGLDYPPLTAYHSWICGAIAHQINPDWVALNTSRGFEGYYHKIFMRNTVIAGDILIFFPAIFVFVRIVYRNIALSDKLSVGFLLLLTPSLLLIDHGHFQYNSISLGLALWAVIAAITRRNLACCIFFTLALCFKQMEFYHALPFFCFLLGRALQNDRLTCLKQVVRYGVTVTLTFLICWLPFLSSTDLFFQVLRRIFPIQRGLYEDKVANFWCAVSVLVKVRQILPVQVLLIMCVVVTLLAVLPSTINLLRNPSPYRFLLSLVNSSLSFFLFSFHVHEKSILLAAVPVSLLAVIHPFICTWFAIISTFSMYPLLVKDGLALPCWAVSGFFYLCSQLLLPYLHYKTYSQSKEVRAMFHVSVITLLSLCGLSHVISPPDRYPHIFPLLISVISCVHFLGFLIFFTWSQLTSQTATYQSVSKMVFKPDNSQSHTD